MNRRGWIPPLVALIALLGGGLFASAQDAEAPTLRLSEEGGFGEHLVTGEGMSVYAYSEDAEGESACTGRCTENWPPLLVDGEPVVGEGVDASLVGTIEREDGGTQVTYAGQPLYTYARDEATADANGQALGERFFLVAAGGDTITQSLPAFERPEVSEEVLAALMEEGERAYATSCAVCHGAEGQGAVGPALADNVRLQDTAFYVGRILNGFPEHGMPPFRDQLNDRQIAAIATYTRNSWDNDFGAVTEERVAEQR